MRWPVLVLLLLTACAPVDVFEIDGSTVTVDPGGVEVAWDDLATFDVRIALDEEVTRLRCTLVPEGEVVLEGPETADPVVTAGSAPVSLPLEPSLLPPPPDPSRVDDCVDAVVDDGLNDAIDDLGSGSLPAMDYADQRACLVSRPDVLYAARTACLVPALKQVLVLLLEQCQAARNPKACERAARLGERMARADLFLDDFRGYVQDVAEEVVRASTCPWGVDDIDPQQPWVDVDLFLTYDADMQSVVVADTRLVLSELPFAYGDVAKALTWSGEDGDGGVELVADFDALSGAFLAQTPLPLAHGAADYFTEDIPAGLTMSWDGSGYDATGGTLAVREYGRVQGSHIRLGIEATLEAIVPLDGDVREVRGTVSGEAGLVLPYDL